MMSRSVAGYFRKFSPERFSKIGIDKQERKRARFRQIAEDFLAVFVNWSCKVLIENEKHVEFSLNQVSRRRCTPFHG